MHRAAYKSMGYSDDDLSRPIIGIANSWNTIVPGHFNLRLVSEFVKRGIYRGGGTAVEFGVIAACDGVAQGMTECTTSSPPESSSQMTSKLWHKPTGSTV